MSWSDHLSIITNNGQLINTLQQGISVAEMEQILWNQTKKHYQFYHLGNKLSNKDRPKPQDPEDFILALETNRTRGGPSVNISNEEQVRELLKKHNIQLTQFQNEFEGGQNPNQIDRLVFHNGKITKFQFMQSQMTKTSKQAPKVIRRFLDEDLSRTKEEPTPIKDVEIVAANFDLAIRQLLQHE